MGTYGDPGLELLGDPSRHAILELQARRPCSVGELAAQLPISRPAVSQHLRGLLDGGLAVSQANGRRRVYRVNPHQGSRRSRVNDSEEQQWQRS